MLNFKINSYVSIKLTYSYLAFVNFNIMFFYNGLLKFHTTLNFNYTKIWYVTEPKYTGMQNKHKYAKVLTKTYNLINKLKFL